MPRSSTIINSFNAGELSPKMIGRTDFAKYPNGCETLENFVIFPQGGATKRPGTYYVAGVKTHAEKVRLVRFEFSTTQAYIIEFGNQYLRFYKDKGQILLTGSPYEIASPYLEADLFGLKFAQSADVLYIVHRDYPPMKLTRTDHTAWTLIEINFQPPATSEESVYLADGIWPGATTGESINFAADTYTLFQTGDVDRQVICGTSRAIITSVPGNNMYICDIIDAFTADQVANGIDAGDWHLAGSPTGSLTPDKKEPKGAKIQLTSTIESFRTEDNGKYISIHDGFIRITEYTSKTVVKGEILRVLTAVTATTSWTMESVDWTATNGYPEAVCFYEGRLWFARDDTLWGSCVEDYENFTPGADDAASVKITLLANEVNAVKWLEHGRALMGGTVGGEWTVDSASTSEAITPTSIKAQRQTTYGCADLAPLKIAGSILFVQRAGRKLREHTYRFETDGYTAPDLTLLADHISDTGIVDLAYQQEPFSIIWAVRSDGVLLGLTYDRSQEVVGWHRHPTDGLVESVAVIPGVDEDEVWVSVQRTINGSVKRYVEYLKPFDYGEDQEDGFFVDCGLTYDGAAATVISGLDHLEGETVSILADGAVQSAKTVASGAITLTSAASVVHVGLPYTATLKTVRIDAGSAMGTAQGKKKRLHEIRARFFETLGGKIGGSLTKLENVYYRKSGDLMDAPPPLFTGDKIITNPQGWNTEGQVMIVQEDPLPMTVLAVMAEVSTSDE